MVLQGSLAAGHLSKEGSRINLKEKAQQTQGIESLDFIERLKPINELQNLGQTKAWFCLAKRNTTLTNPYNNISNERLRGLTRATSVKSQQGQRLTELLTLAMI